MATSTTLDRDAATAAQPTAPDEAMQRLEVFVGKWVVEGKQLAGLVLKSADITALETYEWLPGRFFLAHNFEAQIGADAASCIDIIGKGEDANSLASHTFYSNGTSREWKYTERQGTWVVEGTANMGGTPGQVRCTSVFSDDGKAIKGTWESSADGSQWEPFWHTRSKKIT